MLQHLDPDVRQQVLSRATRRTFRRGDVIFWEDDPASAVHVIMAGRVVIELTTPLGDTAITGLASVGDVIGEQALLSDTSSRGATARCIEPVTTQAIAKGDFEALRDAGPAVDQFLIAVLEQRVRDLTAQLVDARHASAEVRVCRKLCELGAFFGDEINITQEVLASMTGTTRVTVNGILRTLQASGCVELGRGRITVLDETSLGR